MREPRFLSNVELTVLELCGVPRRTSDIAFLYRERGGDSCIVQTVLFELERWQLVSRDSSEFWRLTNDGDAARRAPVPWEAVVDGVLSVSVAGHPLVICRVRFDGVDARGHLEGNWTVRVGPPEHWTPDPQILAGDGFVRNGHARGRVLAIGFLPRRRPPNEPGTVALWLDLDVDEGDILTGVTSPIGGHEVECRQ